MAIVLFGCLLGAAMLSPAAEITPTSARSYNTTKPEPPAPDQIIQLENLIISKKPGYLYMVWDVFSHRELFDPKDKLHARTALRYAAYIAYAYGFQKHPDYPEARMNIIVFTARDEYGGPRWDLAEKWYAFNFLADKFKALKISRPESLLELDDKKLRSLLADDNEKNRINRGN
jgi:hypothetical protein